ncbi:MAG: hypothetical protein JSR66_13065 [Proteobacteria bacterium]|nr:hypothetical protein [Pseudomonadota bacterium]
MKSQTIGMVSTMTLLAGTAALLLPALQADAATKVVAAGSTSPRTGAYTPSGDGDVTKVEFPQQEDEADGPGPYPGIITNRSLSQGSAPGATITSGQKAKSNPQFNIGFEGLNLFQQRYARGGNQFTVEPPDQALCAGGGYVVEAVNDVLNVFNTSGQSVLPDNTATNIVSGAPTDVNHAVDLNSFLGYLPAINRSTGVRAQSVTDPSCLYDAATQRFFFVALTLENLPNGVRTLVNHLDIAVSKTPDPTAGWTIYRVDVTNDGTNIGGVANGGPYLGDYPHIGADAYGFYVTTNSYPWNGPGFGGAQIYAFSKAQLAAGAANVNMVHFDTTGRVPVASDAGPSQPGFTVWPAQSPGISSFNRASGGTEYFMSSNAADEATHPAAGTGGNYTSNQIVVWTLTNTSSLDSNAPALNLSTKLLNVNLYAIPPKQQQPGSGVLPGTAVPQGHCINDTSTVLVPFGVVGCWQLLFGGEPAHNEVGSVADSNDTRMQQVTYANGRLWGALDTAINPDGGGQRAGIAWYIVNPDANKVVQQGYLGSTGYDFTYPAIGVTASGRGVMAFTASGGATNPSAAFAAIDANTGVTQWNIVPGGQGAAPNDGFTGYKAQVGDPPRTRWGDYGAAAVDGNSIWIASEYIGQACNYTDWGGRFFTGSGGDNKLGTCAPTPGAAGARAALGNWSTRISKLTP